MLQSMSLLNLIKEVRSMKKMNGSRWGIAGLTVALGVGILITTSDAEICPFPPRLVKKSRCQRATTTEAGNELRKCMRNGPETEDCEVDFTSNNSCAGTHWAGSKNGRCVELIKDATGSLTVTNCEENSHTRLMMIYQYMSTCDGRQFFGRKPGYCRCSSVILDPPQLRWVSVCECEEQPDDGTGWWSPVK